jgi:hypothetical protein
LSVSRSIAIIVLGNASEVEAVKEQQQFSEKHRAFFSRKDDINDLAWSDAQTHGLVEDRWLFLSYLCLCHGFLSI